MSERADPLVPLLGLAVAFVVVGAFGVVFYPRVVRWLGPHVESVVGEPPSPTATVPVWISRTQNGVALVIEADWDPGTAPALDRGLQGGPYRYLRLSVYNFAHEGPYGLKLPPQGFASPEGGEPARPAAAVLRADAPEHLRAVLRALGAVERLEVAKGCSGHALLVTTADPRRRTAFVSGELRFERRELPRRVLASWQRTPDWEEFNDF